MFYSRPEIAPLNWDLEKLPEGQDFTFSARTTDGHPVSFKYRGGWITVFRGEKDAAEDNSPKSVFEKCIGPPAHWGILPEQLCDLLGITVQGQKIIVPEEKRINAGFSDWSGKTTYWISQHYVLQWDAERLVQDIADQFPDTALAQWFPFEGYQAGRYRRIDFFSNEDKHVIIGAGVDEKRFLEVLNVSITLKEHCGKRVLPFDFMFRITRVSEREQHLIGKEVIENSGARQLNLKYDLVAPRKIHLFTDYKTDDAKAQECMRKVYSVLERHFQEGVEGFNLETGKSIQIETGGFSYSTAYRDWCLAKEKRFLAVGVTERKGKKIFFGLRPQRSSYTSWMKRFFK